MRSDLDPLRRPHDARAAKIIDGLRGNDADDVLVVVDGTIPANDAAELSQAGSLRSSRRALQQARSSTSSGRPSPSSGAGCSAGGSTSRIAGHQAIRGSTVDGQDAGSRDATSGVGIAGRVDTTAAPPSRQFRAHCRRHDRAATDSSRSASGGTVSSTERAGSDPGATRPHAANGRAVELEHACPGRDRGCPSGPRRQRFGSAGGNGEQQSGGRVQEGERVDVGAVLGVNLEVEVVDPLGVT